MKTLDEVKAQIEPILKQQKAQQIAQGEAEELLFGIIAGKLISFA